MSNFPNFGFIKKFRSSKAKELKRKHTAAFLILDTLSENAKRDSTGHPLLELGEGILTAEECGISSQQFETGIKYLELNDYVEVIHKGRKDKDSKILLRVHPESTKDSIQINSRINGTVLKLINSDIYDINLTDTPNHIPNQTRINSEFTPNKQEIKKYKKYKEDHHPYPSSKISNIGDDELTGLTDDFLLKPSNKKFTQHNIYNQIKESPTPMLEVVSNVFMPQSDLDACLKIKGSLDAVKKAIEFIMKSPTRKKKIQNWPNALSTWEIKSEIKPMIQDNEKSAKTLCEVYDSYSKGNGYQCNMYNDSKKDQRGVLFECQSSYVEPFFVALVDPEFNQKVSKFIREKKMELKKAKENVEMLQSNLVGVC